MNVLNEAHSELDMWSFYNADSTEAVKEIREKTIDFTLYSPPFSGIYLYSESMRDMANCANDGEFFDHYRFLVSELYRITRPGRLVAVHCKDLVDYKGRDGEAGLRDFPGGLIKLHEQAGFKWASRVTIWRDPVLEMQKTKAHGLLYKTLRRDSTHTRQGMGEYMLVFRRWPQNEDEEREHVPVTHSREGFPLEQWQRWASPIWTDIDHARVLNVQIAREDNDERHMCPLSLDVVERACVLWSNPGDTVFSPFGGIGSEGVGALNMGRKFVGMELKEAYLEAGPHVPEGGGVAPSRPVRSRRGGAMNQGENLSHASGEVRHDSRTAKAQHSPAGSSGGGIEGVIVGNRGGSAVPVVAVCLNDQEVSVEHEVRLPSTEHRSVHLECEAEPLQLVVNGHLDLRHLRGETLPQPGGTELLAPLVGPRDSKARRVELLLARRRLARGIRTYRLDALRTGVAMTPSVLVAAQPAAERQAALPIQFSHRARNGLAALTARDLKALSPESILGPTRQGAESRSLSAGIVAKGPLALKAREHAARVAVSVRGPRGVEALPALHARPVRHPVQNGHWAGIGKEGT